MTWIVLRLSIFAIVMAAPHVRTHQGEMLLLASMLGFDLIWLLQRRVPEVRTAATLLFSLVFGATCTFWLLGGSMVSLAFLWPSLMLRLEDASPKEQRAYLVACSLALAILAPDFPLHFFRIGLVVLSLLQFGSGRLAAWANTAALAWLLGPLVEVCFFPGISAPVQLARTALLMTLPQLGLRKLNHESGQTTSLQLR